MGASVSQEVNAKAMESLSIINNQTQDCITTGSQSEVISICEGQGCSSRSNVNISGINFQESAVYTTQCSADINITTEIQQRINSQFAQEARAIAQQFQLSGANVDQVTNAASGIADSITTNTVQRCVERATQNEGIVITCGPHDTGGICNINIRQVNFSEGFTPINNCILQDTQVQGVISEVTQIIQQQGTAKVESIFGPLITLLIIIVVVIIAVIFGGTKALTDWRLWIVIIILILIYLGIAYWRHWFPFEHSSN